MTYVKIYSYLCHFTDADPNNYMSYYKRATVFLALSRSRPALSDLDKVIQLKSDFQAVSLAKFTLFEKSNFCPKIQF